ncbi:alpha-1,4-N-acetyl-D-galactosaminyltransferase [compost metagenome]
MSQQEVLQRYGEADIFALPCRIGKDGDRDGLPNVLVEAASQRILCISTTISGIPELFVDQENGLLVEPEDPLALAKVLEIAIRNPSERDRMARNAEAKVRGHFDHKTSISDLERLFSAAYSTLANKEPSQP